MHWLTKRNYYVFHNISGLGPCDLIALNDNGRIIKIDVKSESIRKTGTHAGVADGVEASYVFTGLERATEYSVTITAHALLGACSTITLVLTDSY